MPGAAAAPPAASASVASASSAGLPTGAVAGAVAPLDLEHALDELVPLLGGLPRHRLRAVLQRQPALLRAPPATLAARVGALSRATGLPPYQLMYMAARKPSVLQLTPVELTAQCRLVGCAAWLVGTALCVMAWQGPGEGEGAGGEVVRTAAGHQGGKGRLSLWPAAAAPLPPMSPLRRRSNAARARPRHSPASPARGSRPCPVPRPHALPFKAARCPDPVTALQQRITPPRVLCCARRALLLSAASAGPCVQRWRPPWSRCSPF